MSDSVGLSVGLSMRALAVLKMFFNPATGRVGTVIELRNVGLDVKTGVPSSTSTSVKYIRLPSIRRTESRKPDVIGAMGRRGEIPDRFSKYGSVIISSFSDLWKW